MNAKQIADIAVARLGLPVPTGKLVIIHSLAQALLNPQTQAVFGDAIVRWLASCELESECLEALAIFVLAPPQPEFMVQIQHAILKPSIASDALISIATGNPTAPRSWAECHSGAMPVRCNLTKAEEALASGTFIPPFFVHQLEELQASSGHPFLKQWAFEFSSLGDRVSSNNDGHFSYFVGGERDNVGQFVARQGHLARSAYLRVLAFAVEHWSMPPEFVADYAQVAFPAEPLFLKLLPGKAPPWVSRVHRTIYSAAELPESLVRECVERVEKSTDSRVMHLSMTVIDTALRHVELEAFAVFGTEPVRAQRVLRVYTGMLGDITLARDGLRAFVSPELSAGAAKNLGFVPALLPLIGPLVGYLQTDFVGRIPYVPFSSESLPQIELAPGEGGAQLRSRGDVVGKFAFWYWHWQASHKRNWPSPTGCCTYLTREAAERLDSDYAGQPHYAWKLTTWGRTSDYEEWEESVQVGTIPCHLDTTQR